MTKTQLAVSWDAYQKNVCKGLSYMQEKGEFVDMTIAADGHYVKVHRMVLSLISPYIKDLISSVDCPHPVIFLNNITYQTLCYILEYIYTGEVLVKKEGLQELILAGKALHIKGLVDMASNMCYDETIPSKNEEVIIENINSEALETNDMDTPAQEYANTDMEYYDDRYPENNDTSIFEESSEKVLERVQTKPPFKYGLPMRDTAAVQYTVSNQGGLQLILNRYIYNMRYISKNSTRRRWKCIHYPRKVKCPAYVTTENDRVIERGCSHNHVFHDKLIMKKVRDGMTFCALKQAELQIELKKKMKLTESDQQDSS